MRWQAALEPSTTSGTTTSSSTSTTTMLTLKKGCPFHNSRKEPPRDNIKTERAIQNLQIDLQRLIETCQLKIPNNISKAEKEAVLKLRDKDDILMTRSDKGGEMVVMKSSHMDRLCMEHLNDTNTYIRLAKDTSDSLRIKINKTLKEILTERNFPTELIQNLQTVTNFCQMSRILCATQNTQGRSENPADCFCLWWNFRPPGLAAPNNSQTTPGQSSGTSEEHR